VARHYLSGPASELAGIWDQLPPSAQDNIVAEVRRGLGLVRTATAGINQTTHSPFGRPGEPYAHYHVHHYSGDKTHGHKHAHEGDAQHLTHDHSGLDGDPPDARTRRFRIVNAAPRPDPWDQLVLLGAELERGQR
jgi:hypothetical protein